MSTSGQEPGVSAPQRATLYVWDVPSRLSMVLTVTSALCMWTARKVAEPRTSAPDLFYVAEKET